MRQVIPVQAGVEIYFEDIGDNAGKIWDAIFEAGAARGSSLLDLVPGTHCVWKWDTASSGNDIDDFSTPLEAGLGWITKFAKPFTASEFLKKQKDNGLEKKLVGLRWWIKYTTPRLPDQG